MLTNEPARFASGQLTGTLLWFSPRVLAVAALATTVAEAGAASPAKLIQLSVCF